MKPVHRRLLWAMRQLRMDPSTPYKKSARVVGEVIGKYHPHGDSSVYDAMVRLAQDFSVRYPLVEGQGNFGNIDGDGAAAFRYTEARLTQVAMDLMAGLDEDAVNYKPTYNNEEQEPELFPGAFPNLLANGAAGIAVGMATNIPPHNVAELYDAAIMLIDQPESDDAAMLQHIQGPDFPTGGLVVDSPAAIAEAYATGRGGFRLRARWNIEKEKGGSWNAIITEIPYGVQKGKLIEQIAGLVNDKKLPILADVRDESDSEIRVVIEPRSRSVEPDMLMESLFKMTDLEVRFSMNLNLLDADRTPRVMSLRQALLAWIAHQFIVLQRRTAHRLDKIRDRIELLDGYIVAYLNLDRVIEIIRTEDEPKPVMMAEFDLNDRQVEAILNMRLRSLRRLEEMELRKEREGLEAERSGLEALLASDARQRTRLKRDFGKLRERYGPETKLGRRRTTVAEAAPARDIPLEAMIEREPITIVVSQKGWIRALKGHLDDLSRLDFKSDDTLKIAFKAETTDKIIVFSTGGRFFTLEASNLPGGRGAGEPIRIQVDMDQDQDVLAVFVHRPDRRLLVATKSGRGFVVAEADVVAQTRKGKQVLNVPAGDEARICIEAPRGATHVAVIGDNRKFLVFPAEQIPEMQKGSGVKLQAYKDGGIADVKFFNSGQGLTWTSSSGNAFTRSLDELKEWIGLRAQAGRLPPRGFPATNRFDNA
eukprot:gene21784-22753_t